MTTGAGSTANSVCIGCGQPASAGILARFAARIASIVRTPRADRRETAIVRLSAEEVLGALGADASPALRSALESNCCIHYTVAEGMCAGGSCGTGKCCYHAVSTDCGIDAYECIAYPCSHGNFSTGC
jgi:hypothetical protein